MTGAALRIEGVYAQSGRLELTNIHINLEAGRTLAVMGLAESGVSLLPGLLTGEIVPRRGHIYLGEQRLRNTGEAKQFGLYHIQEESSLVQGLNVAENIFLLRHGGLKRFFLYRRDIERQTIRLLETVGLKVPPTTRVDNLSVAQGHLVEFAKALGLGRKVLLFWHSLEGYSTKDRENLASLMKRLSEQGISFILYTNRLSDAQKLADELVFFRAGRVVKKARPHEVERNAMEDYLLGEERMQTTTSFVHQPGEELLTFTCPVFRQPITIRQGEIVTLVCGSDNAKWSAALYLQQESRKDIADKASGGNRLPMVFIDLYADGKLLCDNLLPWENLMLPMMSGTGGFPGILDLSYRTVLEKEYGSIWDGVEDTARLNSRQRLALSLNRWLIHRPKLLVMMEPFVHSDLEEMYMIDEFVQKIAAEGTGVVLLTARPPVGVANQGRVEYIYDRKADHP